MTKTKGMRDVQTLSGLAHRAVTGTRRQAANELAYLEHEKDRLKRELEVWACNQRRAESRLQSVRQRMAVLQRALEDREPSAKRRAPSPNHGAADDRQEVKTPWREVTLEY